VLAGFFIRIEGLEVLIGLLEEKLKALEVHVEGLEVDQGVDEGLVRES